MTKTSLKTQKSHVRRQARLARATASKQKTTIKLESYWPFEKFEQKSFAGYWPIKDEIDPRPLLQFLHDRGSVLALPAIIETDHPLEFRQWHPTDNLISGPFDTLEPPKEARIILPDVIFVPMLAFTSKGDRMGYGGGFYDRTLAKLREIKSIFACGVAFSGQKMDYIPTDDYDQKLDGILTEEYFHKF